MEEFLPTSYNEDEDEEVTYRAGFAFVMREQSARPPDETLLVVLGDMADVALEGNLPCSAELRADYERLEPIISADDYEDDNYQNAIEELNDATFYPPEGLIVDFDGDAGTVLTTLTAGWPSPTDHVDCDRCRTNHPADQHCEPVK